MTEIIESNKNLEFTDYKWVIKLLKGSSPRFLLQYYSLVCIENYLFIVGIGQICGEYLISIFLLVAFVCTHD